jgi:hypothetical protein
MKMFEVNMMEGKAEISLPRPLPFHRILEDDVFFNLCYSPLLFGSLWSTEHP